MSTVSAALEHAYRAYRAGQLHQAEIICRQVLASDDRQAGGWHLLSLLADRAGRDPDALQLAERAVNIAPQEASYWNNLGSLCEQQGQVHRAEQSLREAVRLRPDYAVGWNNLGEVYKRAGRADEATAVYRRAIEIEPDFSIARSNLCMSLIYSPTLTGREIVAEHRRVARWWSQRYLSRTSWPNVPEPNRRLRVGYVSPDFREHAVSRFFEPLLAAHDRTAFDIYLYSECPISDPANERIRSWGDAWRVTWQRDTASVVQQVVADRIDLLVDLAAHTRNNRLDVLALRPAPIEITYLGYPSITGLEAMDYRLTDAVLDPPEEEPQAADVRERFFRISAGYACFQAPAQAPAVAPVPSPARGVVTLASHHPMIKLSDVLLSSWGRILERLPEARLLFFRSDLRSEVADTLRQRLAAHGIDAARYELRAVPADPAGYLAAYEEVDLLLDAFPVNAHTMTLEALWMGVPVVTLYGDRTCGRLSASVYRMLDLPELVAESVAEYEDRVVHWARDVARRQQLRAQLRERVRERFAASQWIACLEDAYRQMWRSWCAQQVG